jgi:uncharacterized protein YceH (UPF0502 family)
LRDKYFRREKRMALIARLLLRQERIVGELATFMRTSMSAIFAKVEELDPLVVEELLAGLPTPNQYSRVDRESPFALYCGYVEKVRPIDLAARHGDLEAKLKELEERLR